MIKVIQALPKHNGYWHPSEAIKQSHQRRCSIGFWKIRI